jgi:hypothetical protein
MIKNIEKRNKEIEELVTKHYLVLEKYYHLATRKELLPDEPKVYGYNRFLFDMETLENMTNEGLMILLGTCRFISAQNPVVI